jgi:hypothetical protein
MRSDWQAYLVVKSVAMACLVLGEQISRQRRGSVGSLL